MKPWQVECFQWDHGNEEELAAHQIHAWEVEDLFYSDPVWVPNRSNRSAAWKMVGRTSSGRALTVVATLVESRSALRPVTGWDTTQGERSKYMKGDG